jgi:hypothetical protein
VFPGEGFADDGHQFHGVRVHDLKSRAYGRSQGRSGCPE